MQAKADLLGLAERVERGLTETEGDRERILSLVKQLEARNPTKRCVLWGAFSLLFHWAD
jgi:hypothetical protein